MLKTVIRSKSPSPQPSPGGRGGQRARLTLAALLALTAGCASPHPSTQPTPAPLSQPLARAATTAPADDKAYLPLEKIDPVPTLAATAPEPTTRPNLDAVELYARARDAMVQGERFTAVTDLEKAVAIDPDGYDLWYDLGKSYLSIASMDDKAIAAFERAAALQPDHLEVQVQLGRLYLSRGDTPRAVAHLRQASQTTEYATDDGEAAVADFFLARALQQAGYDRAALDRYDLLLQRLRTPTQALRRNPELGYLMQRPELLYLEIGQLYEKHGAYEQALAAYQPAADREPDNFDLQSRVARVLAELNRRDDALAKCADEVVRTHASPESLALLSDTCNRLGLPDVEVAALQKLHRDRPDDRPVLIALADTLIAQHRSSEALSLMERSWARSPGDVQLVRRTVALQVQAGKTRDAARVLTLALAHNPDALRNFSPLWSQLLRPSLHDRVRLVDVQQMDVPPDARAAKLFWVSRVADLYHRDALTQSSLEKAVQIQPPFAPAFRELLQLDWANDQFSVPQKVHQTDRLASLAQAGGNASLSTELQGRLLMNQSRRDDAADLFARAMEQAGSGHESPELLLIDALASRKDLAGRDSRFEQLLWKLISDHPLFDESYALLFRYYAGAEVGDVNQAVKVLGTWLNNDPGSTAARVLEASVDAQLGSPKDAEAKLLRLFDEDPDDSEVLAGLGAVYDHMGNLDAFTDKLENYRAKHPRDTDVASKLVSVYAERKRPDDARRVLDETRAAVAGDPDLLYTVAQLYTALDDKPNALGVLQEVVRLDPTDAGASNDLGFEWADEGKNLSQAESLIRTAVAAEPDNSSFLDSLGWVLYKRGNYAEAARYLQQAVGPAAFPDPVVLDHLGDTLFRLSQSQAATDAWQRSLKGIGDGEPDREDLKLLRTTLQQKLKQAADKRPVDLAPVGETPPLQKS